MSSNLTDTSTISVRRGSALLIAIVALPLTLAAFFIFGADLGQDFIAFGVMGICFLALAGIFLFTTGPLSAQWCTAPGYMTIVASLEFVVIPFSRFVSGDDRIDSYYLKAMVYLLFGFAMFWLACWILKKPYTFDFMPQLPAGAPRAVIGAFLLFGVGTAGKVILWKLGIIGYEAATMRYTADISAVGMLGIAGQCLTMAMLISGIEVIGKRSKSFGIRLLFIGSAALDLGFGLISGMKVEFLSPIFALVMLLGITQKRLPRLAWALPLFYLLLQPFVLAYRMNLNAGYSAQINTVEGLTSALTKSVEDMLSSNTSFGRGHRSYFDTAGSRLSVLTLFHNVLQLPSPDLLNGDETLWMAPFYPFIPRVLWKEKPIFDKGIRMSEALGIGRTSSTNVPGIADLYALGGIPGIAVGMFIWGGCLQMYMNSMRRGLSERELFLYVMILLVLTNIERDIIAMIGGVVESTCIYLVMSWLVYGGRLFSMKSANAIPYSV
jgi:hypothetical protein